MKWLLIIGLALLAIFMGGFVGIILVFVMSYFTVNHFLNRGNGGAQSSNGLFGGNGSNGSKLSLGKLF